MLIERSPRCRTSEKRSYRWVAMLTIVAMLGFAGFALADTGNNHGTKIVPGSSDVKAKSNAALSTADAPVRAVTTTHSGGTPLAPPVNDDCTGAVVIPGNPGFPYNTGTYTIVDSTPDDGTTDPAFTCQPVDHTIWFSFTPDNSGLYSFDTCYNQAPGSNVFDNTIAVLDSTAGACPATTSFACDDSGGACNCYTGGCGLAGAPYTDQGKATVSMAAGHTYFIVVGAFQDTYSPGYTDVAMHITVANPPSNDTCSAPTPLTLDRIVFGTTAGGTNDYRSTPNACFNGFGQIPSTSNGLDVVFSFTPPDTDKYSIRYVQDDSAAALRSQSPVLYLASDCPPPDPTGAAPPTCLYAANRMNDQSPTNNPLNGNRSEEIKCVTLTGGTPYYLFFDDRFTANPGGPLALEVTRCKAETEPNDTPATANLYAPNSGCFMEGTVAPSGAGHCSARPTQGCGNDTKCWTCSIATTVPCWDTAVPAAATAGQCTAAQGTCGFNASVGTCVFPEPGKDVDFYDLGAPPTGSKIFVGLDGAAANVSDFELRVTSATDTLGYDDDDGTSWTGANSPAIGGAVANGLELYARVDSVPLIAGNEPYSLFARIETGVAQNENLPDDHGVDGQLTFTRGYTNVTGGGFVKGIMSTIDDMDCFKFLAHTGDNVLFISDNNPNRTAGLITNVWPSLATLQRLAPSNTVFFGQILRNNVTASPGTLTGLTPSVTSEFSHYRARYDGAYMACFTPTSDSISGHDNPPPGAYPLPYQGSISLNCGPVPVPAPADVSVTKTGPIGLVRTGDFVTYVITITNNDPTAIAEDVRMFDQLPPEVVYLGATIDNNGFPAGSFACASVPDPGQNNAPLDCTIVSIAGGAHVTFTVQVQVNNCSGAGLTVTNNATISSFTVDPIPANNVGTWTFITSEDGSCQDLACDTSGCISNACTTNDHCESGTCVSTPLDCDDHTVCTLDSCDPSNAADPCINDSSQYGDLCNDGNDCTFDTCDPVTFCQFPPTPAGSSCNDFANCTNGDACDGNGGCFGSNVCDDGQPCTDDFADEANNCACTNDVSFQGTLCEDGNPCTTGTTCDGVGGTAASCVDPTGTTNCDDSNPCTDDSCDPASGCVHANNTASCNDGNACTANDTCGGGACAGTGVTCNDSNACTDDTCNPATGCVYTNNTSPCNDGNACTSGDTCGGGSCSGTAVSCNDGNACNGTETCNPATGCVSGTPLNCSDGNACNGTETCNPATGCVGGTPPVCNDGNACNGVETCNPATGCVSGTPLNCNDGNACNGVETCNPASGCVSGTPLSCNDNNPCTNDTCNPATGCVYANNTNTCSDGNGCTVGDTCGGGVCNPGAPKVCAAPNSCQTGGTCNPSNGVCTYVNKPDGAACDDGSLCTSNDVCTGGVCGGVSNLNEARPKTVGYWKSLCNHDHSGDQLTTADAACVSSSTTTFHPATVSDICAVLQKSNGDEDDHGGGAGNPTTCDKAKAELMAFALNRCRNRVCDAQEIDTNCPGNTSQTVGENFHKADTQLSSATTSEQCSGARCLSQEINTGRALRINDAHADRTNSQGQVTLRWSVPLYNNGTSAPRSYQIFRRPLGTSAYTLIGTVTGTTFSVQDANTNWEYDVVPVQ